MYRTVHGSECWTMFELIWRDKEGRKEELPQSPPNKKADSFLGIGMAAIAAISVSPAQHPPCRLLLRDISNREPQKVSLPRLVRTADEYQPFIALRPRP